jgi:hypothetical protein
MRNERTDRLLAEIKQKMTPRRGYFFLRPGESARIEVVSDLDDVVLINVHRVDGKSVLCEMEANQPRCSHCESGDIPHSVSVFQVWVEGEGDAVWAVAGVRGSLLEAIEQVYTTRGVPVSGMKFLVERLERGYVFSYQGQSRESRQKLPKDVLRRRGLEQIASWSRTPRKSSETSTPEVMYDEVPF